MSPAAVTGNMIHHCCARPKTGAVAVVELILFPPTAKSIS